MNKTNLIIATMIGWILSALYMVTLLLPGLVIYYVSKMLRVVGFILLLAPNSAKNELSGFWNVYKAIGDIFPKK